MASARRAAFVLGAALVSAALTVGASCTHGGYDGSYEGGLSGEGGTGTTVTQVVASGKDVVVTNGALQVTVPNGTFPGSITMTITQLADQTAGPLVVPSFSVTAEGNPSPALPIQLVFTGNTNGSANTNSPLVPASLGADGTTFTPLPIAGFSTTGGGSSNQFWGLTKTYGVFSLIFENASTNDGFVDVDPSSCLNNCCTGGQAGGSAASEAVGGGCVCEVGPNVDCFAKACPDIAAAASRCQDLASPITGAVECEPLACSSTQCAVPGACPQCNGGGPNTCSGGQSICCVSTNSHNCNPGSSGSSPTCNGVTVRCSSDANCPTGTTCCAFADDTHCAATCPNAQRLCTPSLPCDGGTCGCASDAGAGACPCTGGTCQANADCPFGTCGASPAACGPL